jgi:hypothetical protein
VRFNDPPDVAGTGLLQIEHSDGDDDLWIYLPGWSRATRKTASSARTSRTGTSRCRRSTYIDTRCVRPSRWTACSAMSSSRPLQVIRCAPTTATRER